MNRGNTLSSHVGILIVNLRLYLRDYPVDYEGLGTSINKTFSCVTNQFTELILTQKRIYMERDKLHI